MVGQVIRSRVFEIESAHNTYAHTAKYYQCVKNKS